MRRPLPSQIVVRVVRLAAPVIQLLGLYVIFHGHYGPGGGFQGGALLAASILIQRMALGSAASEAAFAERLGTLQSAIGVLIFAGIGLLAWAAGGQYLDFSALPLGLEPADLHSQGILLIEVGVGAAVMATLVSIYDDLIEDAADGGADA